MKIVIDMLIGLRKLQADMAIEHLSKFQSAEGLMQLNGMYRGIQASIDYIEKALEDENDRRDNL